MANFSHFFIAKIALLKIVVPNTALSVTFIVVTVACTIFAVLFGLLLFTNPEGLKGS